MTARPKVVVAYCHPGEVSGPFHQSIVATLFADQMLGGKHYIVDFIDITSGPRIASARNKLVRKFLDHKASPDWLWMLDSDMSFGLDILPRLLKTADRHEFPIMGGLCFGGRGDVIFPTLYRVIGAQEDGSSPIERCDDFPENAIVKVDATGAACLLIHRSVLEKMAEIFPEPAPWFAEAAISGIEFGEDVTFCLRADRAGFPIHVDTGALIGHVKPRIIGLEEYQAQKAPAQKAAQ